MFDDISESKIMNYKIFTFLILIKIWKMDGKYNIPTFRVMSLSVDKDFYMKRLIFITIHIVQVGVPTNDRIMEDVLLRLTAS